MTHATHSYRCACPFCGSSRAFEDVVPNTGGNLHFFMCQDCHAQGPWSTRSVGPLDMWNKRPPGPSGGVKVLCTGGDVTKYRCMFLQVPDDFPIVATTEYILLPLDATSGGK